MGNNIYYSFQIQIRLLKEMSNLLLGILRSLRRSSNSSHLAIIDTVTKEIGTAKFT